LQRPARAVDSRDFFLGADSTHDPQPFRPPCHHSNPLRPDHDTSSSRRFGCKNPALRMRPSRLWVQSRRLVRFLPRSESFRMLASALIWPPEALKTGMPVTKPCSVLPFSASAVSGLISSRRGRCWEKSKMQFPQKLVQSLQCLGSCPPSKSFRRLWVHFVSLKSKDLAVTPGVIAISAISRYISPSDCD
jgi:hypothetical protein